MLAIFVLVPSFATPTVLVATASQTLWYAIALRFFFNVDSGFVELFTMASLSQ
jgi:hypothetical protein